jgi:dihydrofolate reductase
MNLNLSLIAAMTRNRVIGYQNRMPWHLPADLQHFKAITLGKPVIMGRKTFDSIGKPLPHRQNIVLTRGNDAIPGITLAHSLDEALTLAEPKTEIMVIGGSELFQQALPLAKHMYLTLIDTELEGDTFFPEWDAANWTEIEREDHEPDEKNAYIYSFITLENKKSP